MFNRPQQQGMEELVSFRIIDFQSSMPFSSTQRFSSSIDSVWQWLFRIILSLGLLVRIVVWWQQRSIYLDEANLIRNFVERDYTALFQNLDYEQYSPPLFSIPVKFCIEVFGNQELSVRLFPLLNALLMLVLFYRLARRRLSPLAGLLAIGFVAFDKIFIDYATECKQYATDGAVALMLLELAHQMRQRYFGKRHAIGWAVVGIAAVWLSMPSVFVLAGIGCFWLVRYSREKNGAAVLWILAVGILWSISFLIYFFLLLQKNAQSTYLQNFHQQYFLAFPPLNAAEIKLLLKQLNELVDKSIGKTVVAIILVAIGFGLGIREVIRQRQAENWLLLMPIVFCLTASACHYYSLIPRLTLFFLPLLIVLVFLGLDQLFAPRWTRYPFLLATIVTLINQQHLYNLWRPFEGDYAEIRQGLDYIAQQQQSNEIVFVYHNITSVARYYTQQHKQPLLLRNMILQRFHESATDIITEDVRALREHGVRKIWLLYDRQDSTMVNLANSLGVIRKRKNFYRGYVLLCEAK